MAATQRKRKNTITLVYALDGTMKTTDKEIRRTFIQYFKDIYCQQTQPDPALLDTYFRDYGDSPWIAPHHHNGLLALPAGDEIKGVLSMMGPDKAPGPDGITTRFLQNHWEVLKNDLTNTIRHAFQVGTVPEQWLACHIILIPKTEDPKTPKDYRPLTIGNTTYRLLMKLLANRLQRHMDEVISPNQSAFLRGRNIADNTILVREILQSFGSARYHEKSFMLKADIGKAFDTLG